MTRPAVSLSRRPWVRSRDTALWLGVVAYVAGSLLLYDAFENRGRSRPYAARLLPGA